MLWLESRNPNQGAEVDKLHPAVILQADPITWDRLVCDSFLMADQPRSLVRSRLKMAH
jgi:mRNA-degrading endonuclease toxin of MazEF toxin-antitoxin module